VMASLRWGRGLPAEHRFVHQRQDDHPKDTRACLAAWKASSQAAAANGNLWCPFHMTDRVRQRYRSRPDGRSVLPDSTVMAVLP